MDELTTEQTMQLRAILERRRDELLQHLEPDLLSGASLPVQEVETSPADKATVRLLNDLVLEAAGLQAAQLTNVYKALARIDEGSYGSCEECGLPIGFSRLQARPEAALCIACQTRAEKPRSG